jgi:HEAT repeat protein
MKEDIAKLEKASSEGEDRARDVMRSYGAQEHVIDKVTSDGRHRGAPINWEYGSSKSILDLADWIDTLVSVYQPFPFRIDMSKFSPTNCTVIFENFRYVINEKALTIKESEALLRYLIDVIKLNYLGWETARITTYYPPPEFINFIANLVIKYNPGDLMLSVSGKEEIVTSEWWQLLKQRIINECNIPRLEYIIEQMHLPDIDVDLAISTRNIEGLIEALDYSVFHVKTKVEQALVDIKETAIHPLISSLNSKKSNVREAAADILGRIKDSISVDSLVQILKDNDLGVKIAAVNALANIGKPAVPALLTALTNNDNNMKKAAIETLGKIKDPQSIKPLIPLLKDDEFGIRYATQRSLYYLGKPAIDPLIEALKDDNYNVRSGAAVVLGDMKAAEAVNHLCRLVKSKHRSDRISSLEALEKIASSISTEYLIEILKDKDKDIQRKAITALGSIGDVRALMPLLNTIKKHKDTREYAFKAIGEISQKSITKVSKDIVVPLVRELIEMLGNNYTWSYASSILSVLDYPVVDSLFTVLRTSKNQFIRKRVLQILAEKANNGSEFRNEIIDLLCQCLRDKDKEVKVSAAFALEKLKDPRIIDALKKALEDVDIRSVAESILKKITPTD